MKYKIELSVKFNGRSMNAEIVSILNEHFKTEERQRDSMVVIHGRNSRQRPSWEVS
ncbi:MAG: Arc family DNA-binding protein [Symbiopectobacterium sp.]